VGPLALLVYPDTNYASPDIAYATLYTDSAFACSARAIEGLLAKYVTVYAYEFSDENAYLFTPPKVSTLVMGAFHTTELPYLFPAMLANSPYGATFSSGEQDLSQAMMLAWSAFARYGSPWTFATWSWGRYDPAKDEVESLVPPWPMTITNHTTEHKCNFWDPFITLEAVLPPSLSGVNP
jgi:para-nitrobenzyl esterase